MVTTFVASTRDHDIGAPARRLLFLAESFEAALTLADGSTLYILDEPTIGLHVAQANMSHLQDDIAGAIIETMNTATKLLSAMRQNPNDWAMAKLLSVARQYGMEVRSTGGSHHVFSHPTVKDPLSIPAHRPIKAIYIKRFVALIDQMQE